MGQGIAACPTPGSANVFPAAQVPNFTTILRWFRQLASPVTRARIAVFPARSFLF